MAPPTQVATLGTSRLSLPVYLHKQGHLSHIDDLEAANHVIASVYIGILVEIFLQHYGQSQVHTSIFPGKFQGLPVP